MRWFRLHCAIAVAVCAAALAPRSRAGEAVVFERDVMAVFSKAGCNLGACHGNLNGKGGFKLSLRGQEPAADYEALLRQADQRRVNLLEPKASLILQKPTGQVVHQGGLRFNRESIEYRLLLDWIESGAAGPKAAAPVLTRLEITPRDAVLVEPVESAQLRVVAHFSDGGQQDVTPLACYEPTNRNVMVDHDGLVR